MAEAEIGDGPLGYTFKQSGMPLFIRNDLFGK